MTQHFFGAQISYQFATMHTVSYEFLMKPEESAGCHQTLSSRVGAGHETIPFRFCIQYAIKNWRWERPGNEASIHQTLLSRVRYRREGLGTRLQENRIASTLHQNHRHPQQWLLLLERTLYESTLQQNHLAHEGDCSAWLKVKWV